MASLWQRLFVRETPPREDGNDGPHQRKKRTSHRRSLSQFFVTTPDKNRRAEPEPCTITCEERIHYPLYNPLDPRHNPEIKARTWRGFPRRSLDKDMSPPKKGASPAGSPTKSLRRARSSLMAFADSMRPKSKFSRGSIPFSPSRAPVNQNEQTPPSSSQDLKVHCSAPMIIPEPPATASERNVRMSLEESDTRTHPFRSKSPDLEEDLSSSPVQPGITKPFVTYNDICKSLEFLSVDTLERTSSNARVDNRSGLADEDDIFGPQCPHGVENGVATGWRSMYTTPNSAPLGLTASLSATREVGHFTKLSEASEAAYFKYNGSNVAQEDGSPGHNASVSRGPRQTALNLPSSIPIHLSRELGKTCLKNPKSQEGAPYVQAMSQCSTEVDSEFGVDLYRVPCREDRVPGNSPLLMHWLASIGTYEPHNEPNELSNTRRNSELEEPASRARPVENDSKPSEARLSIRWEDEQKNFQHDNNDGQKPLSNMGHQSDLFPPRVNPTEISYAELAAPSNTCEVATSVPIASEKSFPEKSSDLSGLSHLNSGDDRAQKREGALDAKYSHTNAAVNLAPPLLPALPYMVQAIDRASGADLDHTYSESSPSMGRDNRSTILSKSLHIRGLTSLRGSSDTPEIVPTGGHLGAEEEVLEAKNHRLAKSTSAASSLRAMILNNTKASERGLFSQPVRAPETKEGKDSSSRKEASSSDSNDSTPSEPMSGSTVATTYSSASSAREFQLERREATKRANKMAVFDVNAEEKRTQAA